MAKLKAAKRNMKAAARMTLKQTIGVDMATKPKFEWRNPYGDGPIGALYELGQALQAPTEEEIEKALWQN